MGPLGHRLPVRPQGEPQLHGGGVLHLDGHGGLGGLYGHHRAREDPQGRAQLELRLEGRVPHQEGVGVVPVRPHHQVLRVGAVDVPAVGAVTGRR